MSEKRFINFYEDGKIVGVADDNDIWLCENGSIVDLLNEQQDFIKLLFEELLNAQRQGYVVNFLHKNRPCSILSKEDLGE